ncbi:MAG TPA: hypothetical protein VN581_00720 [Patescibacteria group bacterium]|nr:hypothetical protein [Patescibacteria group bacterium]
MSAVFARAALLFALLASTPIAAEIIGVRGSSGMLEIYGAETGTIYANGAPGPCCFIATGATARNAANDWQWVGAVDGGVGVLYRFDAMGARSSLDLPANARVVALAFDAPRNELVALLRDAVAGDLSVLRYAYGAETTFTPNPVASDCCNLRAGLSTWSPQRRSFLLIGQRTGDVDVSLVEIGFNGSVQSYTAPAAAAVQALSVDTASGLIYALLHDSASATTTLQQVSIGGTNAAFSAIGSGESGCCFVLAGTAVIDGGRFQAFAYPIDSVTPTLYRFDLVTGAASPLPTTAPSAGLQVDAALPVTAFLFRDGFE